MKTYAELLKELIDARQVKQVEMADALDISSKRINTYVNGRAEPDFVTAKKIAEYLDAPIEYFFGIIPLHEALDTSLSSNKHHVIQIIKSSKYDLSEDAVRLIRLGLLMSNPKGQNLMDLLTEFDDDGLFGAVEAIERELAAQKYHEIKNRPVK
jgi:transcriptional regulator with XRE-family HTH domain